MYQLEEKIWFWVLLAVPVIVVVFLVGLWGGVWAEKVVGRVWMSQNAQRWGHNVYDIHLTRGLEPGTPADYCLLFADAEPRVEIHFTGDAVREVAL